MNLHDPLINTLVKETAHLRPKHRRWYNYLDRHLDYIREGEEMEYEMSKYSGMDLFDCYAEYRRLLSSFGARFGISPAKALNELCDVYGVEFMAHHFSDLEVFLPDRVITYIHDKYDEAFRDFMNNPSF